MLSSAVIPVKTGIQKKSPRRNSVVIPAQAGIQKQSPRRGTAPFWFPVFTGMTCKP